MNTHLEPNTASARLYSADHLLAARVIQVVLHHLAVIYAVNTPFFSLEPDHEDGAALLTLVSFQLLNQAYFMGFFVRWARLA